MSWEYKIIGKELSPKEKKEVIIDLKTWHKEALEPIDGELEKTSEELKFIEKVNYYLNKEFQELGIKEKVVISPKQIHFLPQRIFFSRFPIKIMFSALHDPLTGAIYINKSEPNYEKNLNFYRAILHESIHVLSLHKYYRSIESGRITPYRTGYHVEHHKEKNHEHFRGLNEMIVDKMAVEILKKNKNELIEEFKIAPEEFNALKAGHPLYSNILNVIIKKIANQNNEEESAVWQRFKKSQFTGEMMHLRDIERTFGKGSLRLIAALASGTKELKEKDLLKRAFLMETIGEKVLRYFETDDEKERERIANEILIKREKLKYQKWKE